MDKLKSAAQYILESLLSAGGDSAQVSVSEGRVEEFNVDAGEFSLIRSVFNSGASMKVIKDLKKGTASVNQLEKEAVDMAVAECIAAAETAVAIAIILNVYRNVSTITLKKLKNLKF